MRIIRFHPRVLFLLVLPCLGAAAAPTPSAGASEQLKFVVVVSRHGVRPPTVPVEELAQYSDQAWPKWDVAPGMLTPHGRELMVLMGKYYGERYRAAGLLAPGPITDAGTVYATADESPRAIETAQALSEAIRQVKEAPVEVVAKDYAPADRPRSADSATEAKLQSRALRSRFSDNMPGLVRAYQAQFDDLAAILGKSPDWIAGPAKGDTGIKPKPTGPLGTASTLVEDLVLEYCEGMPVVGWGRVTREKLTNIYLLHALQFDYAERTAAIARANDSNLAARVLSSLQQAATGQAVPGALGGVGTKLAIVGAHDGNISSLGGLLGVSWISDGLPQSPTLPGGALVFELWQRPDDQRFFVHGYYIAQSLDQMRSTAPLSLQQPPSVSVLMLPGATTGIDNEAPLPKFQQGLTQAIDPRRIVR
jgi:4-phytase/acid phosphatase